MRTKSRTTVGSVALILVGTGSIGLAAPAFAVTNVPVTVTCVSTAFAFSTNNFSADIGDTITLTNNTSAFQINVSGSGVTNTGVVNGSGGTRVLTVSSATGGQVSIVGGQCLGTGTITFTASGGGSSSSLSSTPAPVVQEFGRPASGTCDAVQPAGLNWSGVPVGGWGQSWSQWMNEGRGGFVCTRTLVYSTTVGGWSIG